MITRNQASAVTTFSQNIPTTASVITNANGTGAATETIVQFGANDVTPSVGNTYAKLFRTANSGATTITQFDDGFEGQEFKLLVNDANTTLKHNANIIMKGGVDDATPVNGSVFVFVCDNTVCREVNKSY